MSFDDILERPQSPYDGLEREIMEEGRRSFDCEMAQRVPRYNEAKKTITNNLCALKAI